MTNTNLKTVLFVCTGNTCRSPMAEALLRSMLCEKLGCVSHELRANGYQVLSAGVQTTNSLAASSETIQVLAEQGVELLDHSSQILSLQLLEAADAVYTMTTSHRAVILDNWSQFETRVELLSRNGMDISDPIGMGIEEYRECKAQIEESLQQILDAI